jgi:DNA-binding NtrC family response regulator
LSHLERILIVAERSVRTALAELLHEAGYDVESAPDAQRALGKIEAFAPHLVLADLELPEMDSIELVRRLRAMEDPGAVVVMAGFGGRSPAVEAMRVGAAGYLVKPLNCDAVLIVLDKVFAHQRLIREAHQLRQRVRDRVAPRNIIGNAPSMQRVFEIIDQVAPSRATVLITGERGTGKELLASAIHEKSPRAGGPFLKLHGAALTEHLLETELFGREHGTLFLDDIGEISPAVQAKLLRFLQEHAFEHAGGIQTLRLDLRLIVATDRDLSDEIGRGRFRGDLYERLSVVTLEMPPLRERRSDIPALAQLFLDRYARACAKPIDGCSPGMVELLMNHDWPGNVRELEDAIARAVALSEGPLLEPRHLPANVRSASIQPGLPLVPGSTLAQIERYAILETLKATGGSTSRAAQILGLSTRTIQYRLHEYNVTPRQPLDKVRSARASARHDQDGAG